MLEIRNQSLIHLVSFGLKANQELRKAVKQLDRLTNLDIQILSDENQVISVYSDKILKTRVVEKISKSNVVNSRFYKTKLNQFQQKFNLYLDCDTLVLDLSFLVIFEILKDFDLVICPSTNQADKSFWHINPTEKEETFRALGFNPLQLQGGVFGWKASPIMDNFFKEWHQEYNLYLDQDQAALIRALNNCAKVNQSVKVYLLSNAFNGGSVIAHNFGSVR